MAGSVTIRRAYTTEGFFKNAREAHRRLERLIEDEARVFARRIARAAPPPFKCWVRKDLDHLFNCMMTGRPFDIPLHDFGSDYGRVTAVEKLALKRAWRPFGLSVSTRLSISGKSLSAVHAFTARELRRATVRPPA